MPRALLFHTIINSGQFVSGDISLIGADLAGLWCPTVTSCNLFIQGSFDTTSGNFVRMLQADGVGDFQLDVGVGSRCAGISEVAHAFPYLRIEASVAQTDVRSFVVVTKL